MSFCSLKFIPRGGPMSRNSRCGPTSQALINSFRSASIPKGAVSKSSLIQPSAFAPPPIDEFSANAALNPSLSSSSSLRRSRVPFLPAMQPNTLTTDNSTSHETGINLTFIPPAKTLLCTRKSQPISPSQGLTFICNDRYTRKRSFLRGFQQ